MPTGTRIRANNVYGVISDNPLTAAAGTFNSISLPLLPVVASAHAVVVLDPKRIYGDPEIVVVTVHTVSSTVASILRGQYGTSPRQHPVGTAWAHVPVNDDWTQIMTSAVRPSDPYRGQTIFETDTNRYTGRSTADAWQQMGLFFDPPHCAVRHVTAASHATINTWLAFPAWDTEDEDTDNMHSTTVNSSRITINTPGLYLVTSSVSFNANATGARGLGLRKNGVGTSPNIKGRSLIQSTGAVVETTPTFASVVKFIASDYIEVMAWQSAATPLAYAILTGEHTPSFTVTWIGRGN